jgi:hypothetical protein
MSEQVPIPLLEAPDLVFTQPKKNGLESAQCVLGMTEIFAQSVYNAESKRADG